MTLDLEILTHGVKLVVIPLLERFHLFQALCDGLYLILQVFVIRDEVVKAVDTEDFCVRLSCNVILGQNSALPDCFIRKYVTHL